MRIMDMEENYRECDDSREITAYLNRPYKRIVYPTGDTGNTAYAAEVIELDTCFGEGATVEDAYKDLDNSIMAYVHMALKKGIPIPEPTATISDYSGKVLVRMPPTLHYKLSLRARQEKTSLNQLILAKISGGETL